MKRVFSSQIRPTAEYVKNILEEQGITCLLTGGEYLAAAIGEIPPIETWPAVWVFRDDDEERALQIIGALELSENRSTETWKCPQCKEQCEAQFDTCWNCGAINTSDNA